MIEERRQKICSILSDTPTSATVLAERFGISRQIIVSDIAVLRASGIDILSTPRGYILQKQHKQGQLYTVSCAHNEEQMSQELYAIVDNGATIIDVVIEHGVYGHITCPLYLTSRFDCDQFLEKIASSSSGPLCELTNGMHMHTLSCPNDACFVRVVSDLKKLHFFID